MRIDKVFAGVWSNLRAAFNFSAARNSAKKVFFGVAVVSALHKTGVVP